MELHLRGYSWSIFLLLLLGSLTLSCAQRTSANCGLLQQGGQQQLCALFFRELEDAFTEDEDVPYELQKVFFPVGQLPSLQVDVLIEITLDNLPNVTCPELSEGRALSQDIVPLTGTYRFEHRWIRSIISFVIEREELVFLESVNFVAFAASFFNHIDFSRSNLALPDDDNISLVDLSNGNVAFDIHIQENLPCIPEESVMLAAWEDILPWLQLYARDRGAIDRFDEDDRGYPVRIGDTADVIDSDAPLEAGLLLPVLTGMHVLMMIATGLIIMRVIITYSKETLTKSSNSPAVSLYWSNVFMSAVAALVLILGNIILYDVGIDISFIIQSSSRAFTFRIVSDITTGALILLEAAAAILTPKCTCSVHIPTLITHLVCCNRCCNYCATKSRAKKLSWFVQTLALWVQMVFLQLAAASIIPVVVVCLRNPTPSIAFATLMAAVYFCLVVFIAHFLQLMRGEKDSRNSRVTFSLLIQGFVFLVFLGIVACVVVVYLRFVQAGSGTSSAAGVFLSLIPTIGISAVSWFGKKQLLSEEKGKYEIDKENEDNQSGIFKYAAKLRGTLSGKTNSTKQSRASIPNLPSEECHDCEKDSEKVSLSFYKKQRFSAANPLSANDTESLNSDGTEKVSNSTEVGEQLDNDAETEKVSLNIEPNVTTTPHSVSSDETEKVSPSTEPGVPNGQSDIGTESQTVSLYIESSLAVTSHSTEDQLMNVDIRPTELKDEVIANLAIVDTTI